MKMDLTITASHGSFDVRRNGVDVSLCGVDVEDLLDSIPNTNILEYVVDSLGWEEVLSFGRVSEEQLSEYMNDNF